MPPKPNPERYLPGIYLVTCVTTGKVYVGSSQNIGKRWVEHQCSLNKGNHHSPHLQRAWKKYGAEMFSQKILEIVYDLTRLEQQEQYYLELYQANDKAKGFNCAPVAGSPRGFKHSEETCRKNSERALAKYQDPEFKAKHQAGQRRRFQQPGVLEAHGTARASQWKITPPGESPVVVVNLRKFCTEHCLSRTQMGLMGRGETPQGSYKGWQCSKLGDSSKQVATRTWVVTSPEGISQQVNKLTEFCNLNNLSGWCMAKVSRGEQASHKG